MMRPAFHRAWEPDRSEIRFGLVQALASVRGARLAGSWSTLEAHLPPPTGALICSLSDADILLDLPPSGAEARRIRHSLRAAAAAHGVRLVKVSVRYRAEIRSLWSPQVMAAYLVNGQRAGAFLAFWAVVGAIEAFGSTMRSDDPRCRSYALAKLFFKMARNVLLLKGRTARSYRELATDSYGLAVPAAAAASALAVKIGDLPRLSAGEAEALLNEEFWVAQPQALVDGESLAIIKLVRRQAYGWYRGEEPMPVNALAAACGPLAFTPAMASAHAKTVRDHVR